MNYLTESINIQNSKEKIERCLYLLTVTFELELCKIILIGFY